MSINACAGNEYVEKRYSPKKRDKSVARKEFEEQLFLLERYDIGKEQKSDY